MKPLKYIQQNCDPLYKFMRWGYGNTVGMWYAKEMYLKYIGFYNGKKYLKLPTINAGYGIISKKLMSDEPFALARLGSSEARGVFKDEFDVLCFYAGFFPKDKSLLGRFKKVYLDSIKNVDVLAVWNYKNHFKSKKKLISGLPNLENIVPLGSTGFEWIHLLKGKKVLVIHPFKRTIEKQYEKRELLGILPEFKSLEVIQAVQTLGDTTDDRFVDWFDALDYMKKEINEKDFDIAIIACGAYGLPLASHFKSIGKQALHVGGGLQLLFGIRGKRWDDDDRYPYNKHWVSPSKEDFLDNYKIFEGGCYW